LSSLPSTTIAAPDVQAVGGDAEPSSSQSPLKVGRLASLSIPGTARGGSISSRSSSHYHTSSNNSNNNSNFSARRSNSNSNISYQPNNGNGTPFSGSSAHTPVLHGPRGFERKSSVSGLTTASTPKERDRDRASSIDSTDDLFTLKKLEKLSELTLRTRKLDILVVDDSEADCAALSEILTSEGHNCFSSCDGIDAIEKFLIVEALNEKHSAGQGHHLAFDVVIVDFVMPGMDGPQCVRRMRDMGFKGLALGMVNAPASEVRGRSDQQCAARLAQPLTCCTVRALFLILLPYFIT
jgi:CheY-like chemotaxis protein